MEKAKENKDQIVVTEEEFQAIIAVLEKFEIKKGTEEKEIFLGGISIKNWSIKEPTKILLRYKNFQYVFRNCTFQKPIEFYFGHSESDIASVLAGVYYYECFFMEDQEYYASEGHLNLTFDHCVFNKKVSLRGRYQELKFQHVCGPHFEFYEVHSSEFRISGANNAYLPGLREYAKQFADRGVLELNKVVSKASGDFDGAGSLEIDSCRLNRLDCKNIRSDNVLIRDCRLKSLELSNLNTSACGRIENIDFLDKLWTRGLSIVNCDLSNFVFCRIDFTQLGLIYISKSIIQNTKFIQVNLSGITLANTLFMFWGTKKEPYREDWVKVDSIKNYELKDCYRQLKLAMKANGNSIEEGHFQVQELTAQLRALKYEVEPRGVAHTLQRLWDIVILSVSQRFTIFGTSFGRSFFWLILWNSVFFLGLSIGFDYNQVRGALVSTDNFNHILVEYIRFYNPLHIIDFPQNIAILFDGIARIGNSYLIYSLIRISRRYIL